MHFSIPDSVEFVHHASPRTSFTGFNVHINGSFHACLRFKQLHSFHEQLKQTFPLIQLPPFPSKRLFLLNAVQLEERRSSLERYIQLIGQDPVFSKSELLRSFLLAAQQESAATESTEVTFDVYLMNGHCIPVKCLATDCSSRVLELACSALALPQEYTYYFALFLVDKKDTAGDLVIKRRLMDFESPFATQQSLKGLQCVLRKCYWDGAYDQQVMRDPVGLNLLYIQAISDSERWTTVSAAAREELASLQARGNKREYLEIARNLPYYGMLHFTGATVDYPEHTQATVIIGNKEICFQTTADEDPNKMEETKFRVTRIRCWKITTIHNFGARPTLELSFEFLMSKNYLKWVQVRSDKAMMMTVCLQSLVSELLNQKSDTNHLRATNVTKPNTRIVFPKRDETNQFRPFKELATSRNQTEGAVESERPVARNTELVKQKLKEISTTVFFKNGQNRVHNEAFEGIGDDDL